MIWFVCCDDYTWSWGRDFGDEGVRIGMGVGRKMGRWSGGRGGYGCLHFIVGGDVEMVEILVLINFFELVYVTLLYFTVRPVIWKVRATSLGLFD